MDNFFDMKGNIFSVLLFSLFLMLQNVVIAQNISIPYFGGFEDSAEIAEWSMNVGPAAGQCKDQWIVGNIDCSEGSNALSISCDGGSRATFGSDRNLIIAYRKIKVDTAITVNLSFDLKCEGIEDVALLNFYFLPAGAIRDLSVLNSLNSADLPPILTRPIDYYSGEVDWVNVRPIDQLSLSAGDEYYMIFAWQNANTDTAQAVLSKYSVSVDNIQITSSASPEPENLQYTSGCDTLFVSWDGYSELYEFQYKASGDKAWMTLPKTKEKYMVLPGVQEGAYDIRVRGIQVSDNNDLSAWCSLSEVICFCPDRHCINYVDLNRSGVTCLMGEASNPDNISFTSTKPIDKGSRDVRSRHTVNWRQNEFDPRTGNKLRTIPEGSLASVRLGNWNTGAQAEGIVFDYTVDTSQADIILMKYAVVLEKPGHGQAEDPYFGLEILDSNEVVIDVDCGQFDFTPENKNIKWQKHGGYVWKDWTAIGLNLSKYHGQNVKIRLVTQDCVRTAHFGYAYFTLDCVDASLKSTSCGETINIEMVAPDGFNYVWTRGEEREFVSNEKMIPIPADDIETYYCEVEYVDVEGCGFTLQTEVKPRFPFADFVVEHRPENCENKVVLRNTSCVHTRIDGVNTPTSEKCETFYWRIDDGNEEAEYISENVEFSVPKTGDTLTVSLTAYLSKGACDSTIVRTIIVPAIYENYDTVFVTKCEGEVYQFETEVFAESGVYDVPLINSWGCDSIRTLFLNFVSQPDTVFVFDTICNGESYTFKGNVLNTAGEHSFSYATESGCDSIYIVSLDVVDPLDLFVNVDSFVCADVKSLPIEFENGKGARQPMGYSILFDDFTKSNGFVDCENLELDGEKGTLEILIPDNCRPNSYTATLIFKDSISVCGDTSITINFDVRYSSSILQPKFGNLIAVLDASENGGYSFVEGEYRWFRNNELLENDTLSYLYLGDNVKFDSNDCYYLEVKRVDDGVVMRTCDICPGIDTPVENVQESDFYVQTSLLNKGQRILVDNLVEGEVRIYTLTGQLVNSFDVSDSVSILTAPNQAGIYILYVMTPDYSVSYKIQVR